MLLALIKCALKLFSCCKVVLNFWWIDYYIVCPLVRCCWPLLLSHFCWYKLTSLWNKRLFYHFVYIVRLHLEFILVFNQSINNTAFWCETGVWHFHHTILAINSPCFTLEVFCWRIRKQLCNVVDIYISVWGLFTTFCNSL